MTRSERNARVRLLQQLDAEAEEEEARVRGHTNTASQAQGPLAIVEEPVAMVEEPVVEEPEHIARPWWSCHAPVGMTLAERNARIRHLQRLEHEENAAPQTEEDAMVEDDNSINGDEPGMWECSVCTLLNEDHRDFCEVCESVREQSPTVMMPWQRTYTDGMSLAQRNARIRAIRQWENEGCTENIAQQLIMC